MDLFDDEEARFLVHLENTRAECAQQQQLPGATQARSEQQAPEQVAAIDISDQEVPHAVAHVRMRQEEEFDEESRFLLHMKSVKGQRMDYGPCPEEASCSVPEDHRQERGEFCACSNAPPQLELSRPTQPCAPMSSAYASTHRAHAPSSKAQSAASTCF